MNWSDERYVKLYTRQTATWRMWPWQSRCVLPLMLQVANGAGLIDVGRRDPIGALSVLLMVPRDVVEPGLAAMLDDGTVQAVDSGLLIPNFIEAQEATKTDALRKRDQRERQRAQAIQNTRQPVTRSHEESRGVTTCPPPAQPSPAQPRELHVEQARLVDVPPTPQQSQALEDKLTDEEFQVFEHWRQTLRHPKAKATPERKRIIAKALKTYTVEECQRAITGCSWSPHHMGQNDRNTRYDDLELILRDAKHLEGFMRLVTEAA